MRKAIILLLLGVTTLFASPEREVRAHLLLRDFARAEECAKEYLNPEEEASFVTYLHCIAQSQDERLWYKEWQRYQERFPENAYDAKLLESAMWGLLERTKGASSGQVRQLTLIAAALTRDVRALPIILQGLEDPNATIRGLAVELCTLYGDAPLKEALKAAYACEKIRRVRAQMISSFGKLRMEEMVESLYLQLEEGRLSAEEEGALIQAIVHLTKGIGENELQRLVVSKRAAQRALAAEVIAKLGLRDKGYYLLALMRDSHPLVAASAIKAVGLLRLEAIEEQPIVDLISPQLQSRHFMTAITAAWLAKLHGVASADKIFTYWVLEGDEEARTLAAAAISALGPYGITLAKKLIAETDDPFVRANLALAFVGQREETELACLHFEELLLHNRDRWMAEPMLGGLFSPLRKSRLTHRRGLPHYPELMSQVVRLEMLSLLAILEHEGAGELMKEFLTKSHFRLTGLAAELLLGEGDAEALSCVRELLTDKDPQIVLEAALALAVLGRDSEAVPYLVKGYEGAQIETKVKILESLSRIKDKSSIPFLVSCLAESSQLLRIITASVLLQTLNS